MGQYFRAVNTTREEYVDGMEIDGVSELFEWCAKKSAGIFPYLLRESSECGGGDIDIADPEYAGRWAGEEVYLVGDYDSSMLYDRAELEFSNISKGLVEEYNKFIQVERLKLKP